MSELQNGLRVATAEMTQMNSVSLGVWIGMGSRYEQARLNGVCHFIEHLLFKGTGRRSAKQISEAVEGIGGYLNAFTSEETTCFHARAAYDRLPELLDVLVDMLLHSTFSEPDIRKERQVIKEEIAMYLDEPQHHVQELFNATIWPEEPLGRPITGTAESLDGMRRAQLLDYLRYNYLTGNTLIAAAGKVSHPGLVRALRPYERLFPTGRIPRFVASAQQQRTPRVRLVTREIEQTHIALGFRGFSRHDDRRYALRLLNTVLGENMSSRLFQIVREDRGLAYSIGSSASFFADTGDLVISAGLDTANLDKVLKLVLRELRRLAQSGPGRPELRRAADYVIGQMDLALESTDARMNWLGEQLLGYGKVFSPARIKRRLRLVTPAQIRAVAHDLFRRDRLNLALVSPLRSDRGLESILSF